MSKRSCDYCSKTREGGLHDPDKPHDAYCLSAVRIEVISFWRAGWTGSPFSGSTEEAQDAWQKGVLAQRKKTEQFFVDASTEQSVNRLIEIARAP